MAATNSFFAAKNHIFWQKVYHSYEKILYLKSKTKTKLQAQKDLLNLDRWYQQELPIILKAREKKYITKDELQKLMTWKLTRGKFRPMLPGLVASNEPSAVEEASRKAFASLPNLTKAIKELSVLRGIGPATASAVLAAGNPEEAPFMADESVLAIPSISVLKYDLNCYLAFAAEVKEASEILSKKDPEFGWSPHKVELTLWCYVMCEKLDPSMLKELQGESGVQPEKMKRRVLKRGSDENENEENKTEKQIRKKGNSK